MDPPLIYTDYCSEDTASKIERELGRLILLRMNEKVWNVSDATRVITDPRLELAVINRLDEISMMEIALLNFMCKPILITARAIVEYPVIERTVDHIDPNCNLRDPANTFIPWFRYWSLP